MAGGIARLNIAGLMSLYYSRILWSLVPFFFISSVYLKIRGSGVFIEFCISSYNSVHLVFPVLIDLIRAALIFTVLFISSNVLHLAQLYIEDEVYLKRLTLLVCLLIGSIAALIFIPHITALLLG